MIRGAEMFRQDEMDLGPDLIDIWMIQKPSGYRQISAVVVQGMRWRQLDK